MTGFESVDLYRRAEEERGVPGVPGGALLRRLRPEGQRGLQGGAAKIRVLSRGVSAAGRRRVDKDSVYYMARLCLVWGRFVGRRLVPRPPPVLGLAFSDPCYHATAPPPPLSLSLSVVLLFMFRVFLCRVVYFVASPRTRVKPSSRQSSNPPFRRRCLMG